MVVSRTKTNIVAENDGIQTLCSAKRLSARSSDSTHTGRLENFLLYLERSSQHRVSAFISLRGSEFS